MTKLLKCFHKHLFGYAFLMTALMMTALLFAKKPLEVFAASDKIPEGVTINGIDVSGMSKEKAKAAIADYFSAVKKKKLTLYVEDNEAVTLTMADFGVSYNDDVILDEALSLGTAGNIISRYKAMEELRQVGKHYRMEFAFSDEAIFAAIRDHCEIFNQPALDSTLRRANGQFIISEGQTGLRVMTAESIRAFKDILNSANTDYGAKEIALHSVVGIENFRGSVADLEKVKDIIGTYTTSFKSSGAPRSANVRNGTRLIDGALLYPGDSFSAFSEISPFTEGNGYEMAGSYLNGMVVDSLGGGICQVSTTLYNAVLRAELEVTERYNHSMIVTYVDPSADAAIAGTAKDFKFVNNTDYPIYIEGKTSDSKELTFTIYGVETRPANRKVVYESEIISTTNPETDHIIASAEFPVGYINVQSAHIGYVAKLWKVVSVDGREESRTQVNGSTYKMAPRSAVVGIVGDPNASAAVSAAIATQNIDYVKGIIASLTTPQITQEDPNAVAQ